MVYLQNYILNFLKNGENLEYNFVWSIFEGIYTGINVEYDITEYFAGSKYAKVFFGYEQGYAGSSSPLNIGLRIKKDAGSEKTFGIGLNSFSRAIRIFSKFGLMEK